MLSLSVRRAAASRGLPLSRPVFSPTLRIARRTFAAPPERESSPHDPVSASYQRGTPVSSSKTEAHVQQTVQSERGAPAGAGASATSSPAPPAAGDGGSGSSAPPPKAKKPKNRIRTFARTVLFVVVSSTGYIVWRAYADRHPPPQLEHDPEKKTIVVLGNGWGATSLLKSLDTEEYNVIVISPRNYFLFTPLLPSVTVGTIDARSVIEPTRFITRHKKRRVQVYEAEASSVDVTNKTVSFFDNSELKGQVSSTVVPYDYLVFAVGAENNTFGIPGVKEHALFLKEVQDAEKIRTRVMDCMETAAFRDQTPEEIDRLLHAVVVGGGPTGVEFAGELHDFLADDLSTWYPEIAGKVKITLVEALPSVLPMFSRQLIDYATQTFMSNHIDVLTKTMVKKVDEKKLYALNEKKEMIEIPYGLLIWATGNTARDITRKLMSSLGSDKQNQRRGLVVDDHMRVAGAEDSIFAMGDCTATAYAPTAQAASQQGQYLARVFDAMAKREHLEAGLEVAKREGKKEDVEGIEKALNRTQIREFHYSHNGSLAYIGSDKAIADLPFFGGNLASAGAATYLFWRSAYISNLFNRCLVAGDWLKTKVFGRDVSRE